MPTAIEKLRRQSIAWDLSLNEGQFRLLEQYAELLANYSLANVIGTREQDSVVVDHILDSLSCLMIKSLDWTGTLVDVGTGGGLPGVPLAIVRPKLQVTLLEATGKKIRFLQTLFDHLDLPNVKLLNARAEDVGRDGIYRESFDIAVARAVASLPVVIEYCAPLVRAGGSIIAMKGKIQEDELAAGRAAAPLLNTQVRGPNSVPFLPDLSPRERSLIVVEKTNTTPSAFPRRVGLAKKRPLGISTRSEQ